MFSEIKLLDSVHVAAPCDADWEVMTTVEGNRVRHCDRCAHRVHNLSAMSREAAEALLVETAGRPLCIQYALRPDGSILTAERPDALQTLRTMLARPQARAASLVATLAMMLCVSAMAGADEKNQSKGCSKPPENVKPAVIKGEYSALILGKRAFVASGANVALPRISDSVPAVGHNPKPVNKTSHTKTSGASKRK